MCRSTAWRQCTVKMAACRRANASTAQLAGRAARARAAPGSSDWTSRSLVAAARTVMSRRQGRTATARSCETGNGGCAALRAHKVA